MGFWDLEWNLQQSLRIPPECPFSRAYAFESPSVDNCISRMSFGTDRYLLEGLQSTQSSPISRTQSLQVQIPTHWNHHEE